MSLFADDLKLYTCYKVDASHDDVQTAIDRLIDWARLWQLQIAIPKCLGFRIINPQWKLAFTINNKLYYNEDNVLPFSDHIRYLGIYHDTRLKYDQHISLFVHTAYTPAVLILRCFHSRDPFILNQAFCVYVRPLLEFFSQVWSPHHKYLIDKVKSVQRFFTKRFS